jgi:quercetin dioxygenase-like cupin family protein
MKIFAVLAFATLAAFADDVVLAPKPDITPKYMPPHKPLTRLPDVKTKHAGQATWHELVVDDDMLRGEYVSNAPGTKVSKRFHPDTREFWIVLDGQIRFDIEGQQPFTASKGWMVQVPMQTFYSMETVGDKPSLRWEVNIAHARTLYAQDSETPKIPGFHFMPVKIHRTPGVYEHNNKPYVTFEELAQRRERHESGAAFKVVEDDRAAGNFIYGYEKDLPPINPKDKGHYHPESSEFWLIMAGQIRYPIEGQGVVIANEGDLVYVPRFTWHAPRWYGPGPSCRFAMNGYPNIAHLFETDDVPATKTTSRK